MLIAIRGIISSRHLLLTITHLGSELKFARCIPDNDFALERATYAIPAPNTLSDRSTMVFSNDSPGSELNRTFLIVVYVKNYILFEQLLLKLYTITMNVCILYEKSKLNG